MSKAFDIRQQAMTMDRENKTKRGYRRDAGQNKITSGESNKRGMGKIR